MDVCGSAVRSAVSPAEARAVFRAGLRTPTAGWCAGWSQANLLAVPRELAYDVLLFSSRKLRGVSCVGRHRAGFFLDAAVPR